MLHETSLGRTCGTRILYSWKLCTAHNNCRQQSLVFKSTSERSLPPKNASISIRCWWVVLNWRLARSTWRHEDQVNICVCVCLCACVCVYIVLNQDIDACAVLLEYAFHEWVPCTSMALGNRYKIVLWISAYVTYISLLCFRRSFWSSKHEVQWPSRSCVLNMCTHMSLIYLSPELLGSLLVLGGIESSLLREHIEHVVHSAPVEILTWQQNRLTLILN